MLKKKSSKKRERAKHKAILQKMRGESLSFFVKIRMRLMRATSGFSDGRSPVSERIEPDAA